MKIHEYNEMMSYLTRPGMKTGGQVIGKPGGLVEPGVKYYSREVIKRIPKIGKIYEVYGKAKDAAKAVKTYYQKTGISTGWGKIKKAAEKYGYTPEEWVLKTQKEKDAIAYRYKNPDIGRDLDEYIYAPDELLTRIEPSAETLAKTNEELIAALKLRRNMNTPEYWSNLEVLSKNTGKSVRILEKELAPEGKKIFPFAEKIAARFDKATIEKMFPSAKNLSRVKEFEKTFKTENKIPMSVSSRSKKLKSYQENPDLWTKRMELIKSKGFDMDKLYTEGELKVLLNSPGFSFSYVESAMPAAIKRIGPTIAKKGQPGGIKQGLVSLNDINSIFLNKISKPTKSPRAIQMSYYEAQKATDEGLFKMAVESFRKVLSRKIKVNKDTGVIEAFTAGGKLNPEITSILQKYDAKVPQVAHLNPVEFAKRTISATKDITVPKKELLGDPRFPGFAKNFDNLYTTENLGFQGPFFNSNVIGKNIQNELKTIYSEMQPLILKYQNKKVPLEVQDQIKLLNGQVKRLLKKSQDAQLRFKEEMSSAAKTFEDLHGITLGKTGPYGEVRLAEAIGKNELKVINIDEKTGTPFILNRSPGALGTDAKKWADLSAKEKIGAKQNYFNTFKQKMLAQIPDANEKKIIEEYLDLYISPIEQRIKHIDPISGKSVARVEDARRTDTSYNEGGRVGLAEGSEDLPAETLPAIAAAAYKPVKGLATGALRGVMSPAMGAGLAATELLSEDPNVTIAGLDLLWPDLVKRLGSKVTTLENFYDKALRMGVPVKYVPQLIKGMTGAGLIMIAGDVSYKTKKWAEENLDFDRPLTEEQRTDIQERKTAVPRMFDTYEQASKIAKEQGISYEDALKQLDTPNVPGINFNQGGRVGFDKGSKPKSPSRRAFLKGITALAALPLVGRFFKMGEVLQSAKPYLGPAIDKVKGMPEWFPGLVKKLWNEGEDVTKTASYGERQVVKRGTLEGGDEVDMIYQMDTGDVSIQVTPKKGKFSTKSGAYEKPYELDYKKGIADEGTGGKPADEFGVTEARPYKVGKDDVDWDYDMIDTDEAMSDLQELENFAKKKK